MADTKISALTALTAAETDKNDVLPIVDTNAVATKKITVANLLAGSPANPNVQQTDIGTAPNEIPLNQYLGSMAYVEYPDFTRPFLVADLPAAGVIGRFAHVTDGDAALAWGATVVNTGSGATPYLVWDNGTAWTVVGK